MKGYTSAFPLFDAKPAIEPVDPSVLDSDRPRLSRNNLAVLERLKKGPATTVDLMGRGLGGLRPGARIFDLKKAGCLINADTVENGVALYTLLWCPPEL